MFKTSYQKNCFRGGACFMSYRIPALNDSPSNITRGAFYVDRAKTPRPQRKLKPHLSGDRRT
jgi:hypothetical protein